MNGQDDTQQQSAQNWQTPVDTAQPTPSTFFQNLPSNNDPLATSSAAAPEPVTADTPQTDWQPTPAAAEPATSWSAPTTPATDWSVPATPAVADEPTVTTPTEPEVTTEPTTGDDLIDIKQKALNELSPLVDHLEQSPEEKFKTTMMMIQASDNQALIPEAYTAAQAITDSKAKAQALLDIVNEINYFIQQTGQ